MNRHVMQNSLTKGKETASQVTVAESICFRRY